MTKFKVTLSFDVDIAPIAVPDADAIESMSAGAGKKSKSGKPEKKITKEKLVAAMREKGMTDEDIEKALAQPKKPPNYQMLLYPEYEQWAAAQQRVQDAILADDGLCRDYVREVTRDLKGSD